jgi:hypothetical protein
MKYLFFLLLGSILVFESCKTAPPPDITVVEENGLMSADVGEGKVIYMRDCTRCHEQMKVEAFTAEQWFTILPRMIKQANLNETESRQVTAYVDWELVND